jgi:hypothetical protein
LWLIFSPQGAQRNSQRAQDLSRQSWRKKSNINRPEKGIKNLNKSKRSPFRQKVVFLQTVNPKYLDVWLA